MKLTVDLGVRPTITVAEASNLLGLSPTSIKRRISDGRYKIVHRDNLREKILIYTDSIKKFLERGNGYNE